jgi:hypothetical protein
MQSPNTTPRKIKWQKNGESTDEAKKKKKQNLNWVKHFRPSIV